MMQTLLMGFSNDGEARKVEMAFPKQDVARSGSYSIFAMPDDQLIEHRCATVAIRWFRPDQDIRLDHPIVADLSDVDLKSYDLVLLWEDSAKRFTPMDENAANLRNEVPTSHSDWTKAIP